MIDIPTVFILGAGSSVPYGYPTGAALRTQIVNQFCHELESILTNDPSVSKQKKAGNLEKAEEFVHVFKKSSIESIDKFLSLNPSFSSYGKIAIIISILQRERSSAFREEMNSRDRGQDWYTLLFNRMISQCH